MTAHILAVEDSRTQAEALRAQLQTAGHRVTVARSGEDALEQLADDGVVYDLVISDVMMPGIDGYELCRRIKTDRQFGRLPVVLLTSLRDPVDIVRGLESGADNFLTKPCEPERLISRVGSVLESRASRDDGGSFRLGAEVRLLGHRFTVDADREQILDLLMGSFEDLYHANARLREREEELDRAREQAVAANQAKSQFISQLAHELRTPLSAVQGFSELLLESDLADRDRRAVRYIHQGGQHLLHLIEDLVDIGLIEAGEIELELEPVAIRAVLSEAFDLVHVLADSREVSLRGLDEVSGCHVIADRRRLRQILINLLSNAVKYNRSGGHVTVTCGPAEGPNRIRLDVTDTGPGIPIERLGRLFVPFDRLGAETSDVEGSGIGLPLVRDLIESMGGTVGVVSTSEDGTTFRVDLPAADTSVPVEGSA